MNPQDILETVCRALREDQGRGDLTTNLLVEGDRPATGYFLAKEACTLAGLAVAAAVFRRLDPEVKFHGQAQDGDELIFGQKFGLTRGRAGALLTGERVALNFLQRMAGIATMTRRAVQQVQGTRARILDTRKTAPLLRAFDKYAVRVGGGFNHRFGLDDGLLIKENHIVLVGGVGPALRTARARAPHLLRFEIEVKNLVELEEALAEQAEVIMLDNMSPSEVREAVRRVKGRALVEVSGGITLDTLRIYAETGVDYISLGALTHSVKAIDISFELDAEAFPITSSQKGPSP